MFEVRRFHLGKVGGPLPGAAPPPVAVPRIQVAALRISLPMCIRWDPRIGLAEGSRTSQNCCI